MKMRLATTSLCLAAIGWAAADARAADDAAISLESLLAEMTDRDCLTRLPQPAYRCLQASSYNRASTHRDRPGWFADSDGLGFIRTETVGGRTEWVIMEHSGPGCITKIWTPYFYYSLGNRVGAEVRIYLDGASEPVIAESLIRLVTGETFVKPPLAEATARAGNSYLPIPFAESCKVTMATKPFYNIINYRAYPPGTAVETFDMDRFDALAANRDAVAAAFRPPAEPQDAVPARAVRAIGPGESFSLTLPDGPAAIRELRIRLVPPAEGDTGYLRSTVLTMTFDGEQTLWCPVGDFFSCADSIHPYHTWQRTVAEDGTMTCRWVMPYGKSAEVKLLNLGEQKVDASIEATASTRDWDERSIYFHAAWRADDVVAGNRFLDWNFIDIQGRGIFVGDAWTVLNPNGSWWGEGDEKIYVDGAWETGFPTHFGTGTEDYYGWAGGVVPTRRDEFDGPFLANVRVGGRDGRTLGFNICTRTRSLDAIPFENRLRFDMEASFGTDIRNAWNLLGYSAVTFWYARPGATSNRPPQPDAAARPILSLDRMAEMKSARMNAAVETIPGAIEFEKLAVAAQTPGLACGPQRPAAIFGPEQWSGQSHFFVASREPGQFAEFRLTEQFKPKRIKLYVTKSFDFGLADISINGKTVLAKFDLYHETPIVVPVDLGPFEPVDNAFTVRIELAAPNPRSRGSRTFMGLDCVVLADPP